MASFADKYTIWVCGSASGQHCFSLSTTCFLTLSCSPLGTWSHLLQIKSAHSARHLCSSSVSRFLTSLNILIICKLYTQHFKADKFETRILSTWKAGQVPWIKDLWMTSQNKLELQKPIVCYLYSNHISIFFLEPRIIKIRLDRKLM